VRTVGFEMLDIFAHGLVVAVGKGGHVGVEVGMKTIGDGWSDVGSSRW